MVLHRSRTPGPQGHPRSIRGTGVSELNGSPFGFAASEARPKAASVSDTPPIRGVGVQFIYANILLKGWIKKT